MNLSFYTAAVGAGQQQQHLDVVANNIANVNTAGFKAERASFSTLMYQNIKGVDDDALARGTGTKMVAATTDFAAGTLMSGTGEQDYAIEGNGFFALFDGATGEVSFTRDGSFTMASVQEATGKTNSFGEQETVTKYYLSDGNGRFVLDRFGQRIEMDDAAADYEPGVFDFINTDGMEHVGGNRFVPVEKNGQVRMGEGKVVHGMLEGSNVDLAGEITKVIEAQRSYSYALKMVQTSDEIETTINNLRG